MIKVKDLIIAKNKMKIYHWVKKEDTVAKALQIMSEYNLGALLVLEQNQVVGIFSERDYARKILLNGLSSLTTSVESVMSSQILYVTSEYYLDECLALMISKKIRHLPVIDQGQLSTVLSLEEITESLLDGKDFMIAELTRYITGESFLKSSPQKNKKIQELIWPLENFVSV